VKDHNIIKFEKPAETAQDALTALLRQGAQALLKEAVEAELQALLECYANRRDEEGRPEVVRNGYLPKRTIQTGLGDIEVQVPRVRDRGKGDVVFHSALLPPYLRRTKSVEDLLPWLYLKGISSGDFSEALQSILGPDARGLSSNTISRLKACWESDYTAWRERDLHRKHYVYFWADGIYFQARGEDEKQCMLVLIGADTTGKKEIVAIESGFRESHLSWKAMLLDLKNRGLEHSPALAVGDGALGFWKAWREVYGDGKEQRCWVHKTANVLNCLPKSLQSKAKDHLHQIWMAENKKDAEQAFDFFLTCYDEKYPKATACLAKDRATLLTFYDFPAGHWMHIRTTNPIESTFATVRHRTKKSKGCLSFKTGETMAFKLLQSAEKRWHRLRKPELCAQLVQGTVFQDGLKVVPLKEYHNQLTTDLTHAQPIAA